jgi:hypothetical protein
MALTAFGCAKNKGDVRRGRAVFATYWLNSVIIASGACRGYQDTTYVALSFLTLLWALDGKAIPTGVAWADGCSGIGDADSVCLLAAGSFASEHVGAQGALVGAASAASSCFGDAGSVHTGR